MARSLTHRVSGSSITDRICTCPGRRSRSSMGARTFLNTLGIFFPISLRSGGEGDDGVVSADGLELYQLEYFRPSRSCTFNPFESVISSVIRKLYMHHNAAYGCHAFASDLGNDVIREVNHNFTYSAAVRKQCRSPFLKLPLRAILASVLQCNSMSCTCWLLLT